MREILEKYIKLGYSSRRIGKELNLSGTTIRYHLKRLGLKSSPKEFIKNKRKESGLSYCTLCKQELQLCYFYLKRNNNGVSRFCKSCTKRQSLARQRKFKQLLVDYKGGKCEKCGYDKCIAVFDFHHIDPSEKDFTLSRSIKKQINSKIKEELDKCKLLCSNCHREEHYKLEE